MFKFGEVSAELISLWRRDDEQMTVARTCFRLESDRQLSKCLAIPFGDGAAAIVPLVEPPKLDAQDRSVQLVEAAVLSQDLRCSSSHVGRNCEVIGRRWQSPSPT